jgi:hypothetical protein
MGQPAGRYGGHPAQDLVTKDNVTVRVEAAVFFRVVDPVKAVVEIRDYQHGVLRIAQTTLRASLGQHDLDDLLANQRSSYVERPRHELSVGPGQTMRRTGARAAAERPSSPPNRSNRDRAGPAQPRAGRSRRDCRELRLPPWRSSPITVLARSAGSRSAPIARS